MIVIYCSCHVSVLQQQHQGRIGRIISVTGAVQYQKDVVLLSCKLVPAAARTLQVELCQSAPRHATPSRCSHIIASVRWMPRQRQILVRRTVRLAVHCHIWYRPQNIHRSTNGSDRSDVRSEYCLRALAVSVQHQETTSDEIAIATCKSNIEYGPIDHNWNPRRQLSDARPPDGIN